MTDRTHAPQNTISSDLIDFSRSKQESETAEKEKFSSSSLIHNKNPLGIQAKLTISRPDDPYEQEADRVAGQVVSNDPPASYMLSINPLVQRQLSEEEEEEEIQTKSSGAFGDQVGSLTSDFSNRLAAAGSGTPLSPGTRSYFEPRFGRDLSDIRVHNGSRAAELNHSINAHAFTRKNNIYFNSGQYAPDTPGGRFLLAHELVHTFQQTGPGGRGLSPQIQRNGREVNPEIAGVSANRFVDTFTEANYDLDYRAVGGNLSRILTLTYSDGVQIDIDLFTIEDRDVDRMDAMANGHLGDGGRIFPSDLTRTTVPRLWTARTEAIAIMEEYNYEFIVTALPAVIFIITLAGMPPLAGSSAVPRRSTRPRPFRPRTSGGSGGTPAPTAAPAPTSAGGATAAGAAGSGGGGSIFRLLSDRVLRFSGRDIVVVSTRSGPRAFYRRTGMGGSNAGGAQPGQWAPFDGIIPGRMLKSRYTGGNSTDALYRFGTQENRSASEWLSQQAIRHGDDVGEVFAIVNEFLEGLGALRMGP